MLCSSQLLSDKGRRKRARDDDEEHTNGTLSFGEHRNKRIHCLPLRSSTLLQKRWSDPPAFPLTSIPHTITPVDSDSEDGNHQPQSHFSPWDSPATGSLVASSFDHLEGADLDVMMDVASPTPRQNVQPNGLNPGLFHTEHNASNLAARMPTPIQPSFAAQVRGGTWGAGPGPAVNHVRGLNNTGHKYNGFGPLVTGDMAIPRTMDGADAEWHAVQNRRLPSPISEGEDSSCSFLGISGIESPGMVLDSGFSSQLAARLESQVAISTPLRTEHEAAMMDIETVPEDIVTTTLDAQHQPVEVVSAPATPSPGRKGHIRSRHTVNSWNWQSGMKKSFSIGYRADCEKCRLKVPGHFNHIVIS